MSPAVLSEIAQGAVAILAFVILAGLAGIASSRGRLLLSGLLLLPASVVAVFGAAVTGICEVDCSGARKSISTVCAVLLILGIAGLVTLVIAWFRTLEPR